MKEYLFFIFQLELFKEKLRALVYLLINLFYYLFIYIKKQIAKAVFSYIFLQNDEKLLIKKVAKLMFLPYLTY